MESPSFRFTGNVHLAGIDFDSRDTYVHPAVYTAGLRHGFVGCLQDVKLDGE